MGGKNTRFLVRKLYSVDLQEYRDLKECRKNSSIKLVS